MSTFISYQKANNFRIKTPRVQSEKHINRKIVISPNIGMSVWRGDCQLSTKRIVTTELPPCPLLYSQPAHNSITQKWRKHKSILQIQKIELRTYRPLVVSYAVFYETWFYKINYLCFSHNRERLSAIFFVLSLLV